MVKHIEDFFPGLRGKAYQVTSPRSDAYNCIAWAAGVTSIWWWPLGDPRKSHWPDGVPRQETLDAFRLAFESLGYRTCGHAELEPGFEKIALFADPQGCPTHGARQLSDGKWTSKLGELEDIEHSLRDLEGSFYGAVMLVMKRPVRAAGAPIPEKLLGASGKVPFVFAIPLETADRWLRRPGQLIFSAGFLDKIEVQGGEIPHTSGQFGVSAVFSVFENVTEIEGQIIGDVMGYSFEDGVWMGATKIATGVKVVDQ